MSTNNLTTEAAANAATNERTHEGPHFLNVHEVARLLQVRASWVYGRLRQRSTEPLPGYRIGKYWRFCERDIIAWVERHRNGLRIP